MWRNPLQKEARFDFEKFKKHVQFAQRIMDDIVDLEMEKINLIIEKNQNKDPENNEVKDAEYHLGRR